MTILSQQERKAKKEHQCDWCGGTIKKGETYDYSSIINDEFYIWKNHKDCMWVAHELKMFDDNTDGVSDSDFWDHIFEYYSDHIRENDDIVREKSEKLRWVIEHRKKQQDQDGI